MNFLLTANLTTKIATEGKGAWSPPPFTFGEQITIGLRLARNSGGAAIETSPVVNSMKAAIGGIDARPAGGTWKLHLGPDAQDEANTTAELQAGAAASTVAAAINALTDIVADYGAASVVSVDGSLLIRFADAGQVAMEVVENRLWPVSLGRISAYERDARWIHEVRLTQTPVAFTSASAEVLPASPEIARISSGGASGGIEWNEIQEITVPVEFRGTYYLQRGFARTEVLSGEDGPSEIAAALNKIADGFTVTATLFRRANIEFTGDLAGAAHDLLEVHVAANPPGDLTFTLALDRSEMAAYLRRSPEGEAVLPLEVRLNVTEDEVTSEIVAFRQDVVIRRPVIWPELEETPQIDWLRPLSPKRYLPYDPSQTLTGQHFYPAEVGDGAATSFVIAHGLDTLVVRTWVNSQLTGAQLIEGTHFTVVIDNANQVTVTALGGAPAADAWLVIVMSAQTVAAFANELTIEQSQVNGLVALLEAIGANLEDLNTLLPSQATVAGTTLDQGAFTIEFPEKKAVLFTAETDIAKLPLRAPFMLPGVHDASVATLPDPLPDPAAGSVWLNDTAAGVLIPGGGHIRSSTVPAAGHVASDGRMIWPARRRGTSVSYYPRPFEVLLFDAFVNDLMFGVGKTLTLQLQLATQLIAADSHAQWMLVIEKGTAPREADPTATAINITTTGTGTHTATTETGRTVGTFTVNTGTDVITLAGHGLANGDVILVASTTTLPGGLAAATAYVVRDATTDTFKLAAVATSLNLRDVIWDTAAPLVRQPLILTPALTKHQIGVTIARSSSGITANAVLYNRILNADAGAPATANFALRGRLMDFDTENSIPTSRGWVHWQLINPKDGILGISIA